MSFINDILDYCQLKDKKLKLNKSEFSLQQLLSEIYKLMKIQTQLKGLHLIIKCDEDNLILNTDLRRIKQILINLLSNAIKFTEQGFIKLKAQVSASKNKIKFQVKDTGSGIEEDKIQCLGQPYQTFSTSTNQNQTGIGLGLNLCKQLITLLGPKSQFQVETKIGIGTKFSFTVYRNLDLKGIFNQFSQKSSFDLINSGNYFSENIESLAEIQNQEIKSVPKSPSLIWTKFEKSNLKNIETFNKSFTILIADDNIFNLLVLKSQLERINLNFKVIQANNGKQAVEQFCKYNSSQNENNIKLIIMDCEMPVMDGYEASKSIMKTIQCENYSQTLIIGYTAFLGTNEEKKCAQAGMCDTIIKPASFGDLQAKIFANFNKLLK